MKKWSILSIVALLGGIALQIIGGVADQKATEEEVRNVVRQELNWIKLNK